MWLYIYLNYCIMGLGGLHKNHSYVNEAVLLILSGCFVKFKHALYANYRVPNYMFIEDFSIVSRYIQRKLKFENIQIEHIHF